MPDLPAPRFHHKALAALLAFAAGGAGLQHAYLGRRYWWLALLVTVACVPWLVGVKGWYQQPAFFIAMVPVIAGFVEAVVLALTPDAKFDARHNAALERRNHSGWDAVLVAILTMTVGMIIALTAIVLLMQTIVEHLQGV